MDPWSAGRRLLVGRPYGMELLFGTRMIADGLPQRLAQHGDCLSVAARKVIPGRVSDMICGCNQKGHAQCDPGWTHCVISALWVRKKEEVAHGLGPWSHHQAKI